MSPKRENIFIKSASYPCISLIFLKYNEKYVPQPVQFKNVKNTHGGVLLLVKLQTY